MELIKKLFKNQALRYIFFGGCTTMVNLVSYFLLRNLAGVDVTRANFFSICLAILFAYVVNKIFVFESKTETFMALLTECAQFIGMRLLTMFIEIFGVVMLSNVWGMQDMIAKLLIQVIVLVLNFIFSKLFVFRDHSRSAELTLQQLQSKKVQKQCIAVSFAIPAVTMLIAYIVNGVYPFGDHGVLIIDSLHQYLPFFTDFREKLVNSESLLYSFGGGLGYNMWATIAYYLASPLNFLMTAISMDHVMDFMAYLILVKISLSGAVFGWYLTTRNGGKDYTPIPFACMYALSSFMIGYYFNLMWLDSIVLLPIVMRGIERIVEGKSGKMHTLALFGAVYCNYYIGYMICLFSCLYFLTIWAGARQFQVKKFVISGCRFAWFSILGGGMASIILLPAYLALAITESATGSFPSRIKFYTDGITQWTGHFAFVEPINIYDDQSGVNIYCGVIILILVLIFALDRKIRISERLSRLILAGVLLFSMNFNILNYIWHGFHTQNGLPNRFAFLYIAVLLVMGFDALSHLRELSPWKLFLSWALPTAFVGYTYWTNSGEREWYVYLVTAALLGVYGVVLLLYRMVRQRKQVIQTILIALMSAEMAATGVYGVCMNGTVSRSSYVDDQTAYQALIARNEESEEFYRSDIDSQRMRNANMFMGANGLVLFSSTMPEATVNLCRAIGMEARTNKTGYNGTTKLFNDVFGIRYLVGKSGEDTLYQMNLVDEEEPLYLYRNDEALSLGFMVSSDIKSWDITDKNAMTVQEGFANFATGESFFYTLRESYSLEEGPTYIIRLHPGEQTYIEFTENVKSVHIKTPQYDKTVNNFTTNLFNLGTVAAEGEDSKANITITYKEGKTDPVPVRVYTCTDEEYAAVYEKLAANQMEQVIANGNQVTGKIHVDEAGTLLLTVPYDRGWKIRANGELKETYPVGEALTGIDLAPGDYEISMVFTPLGLMPGTGLSIACMALFMLSIFAENYLEKRKSRNEEAEDEDYILTEG
ncbi:MAG: GtrA family protein [Eubacteriales bacterium]|nr:GtrA family protein [Eubacteriales bacterium]